MQIRHATTKQMRLMAKVAPEELSREARLRLKVVDYVRRGGHSIAATARHFGVSRSTVYRWLKRFNPHRLHSLESRPTCPKRRRRNSWGTRLVEAVRMLRGQYPRWGKDKLVILVLKLGLQASTSTVGRILAYLKKSGRLREPLARAVRTKKRLLARPHAIRMPKGYAAIDPGDIVQVDTLHLYLSHSRKFKQYTAVDCVSRWACAGVHERATARTAATFLMNLLDRVPFEIKAIQIDNGSEFMAEFEEACKRLKIMLIVLPPRSPKLNGCVERLQRTHREEFWEATPTGFNCKVVQRQLDDWLTVYNTIRPHQSLNYLTPVEELRRRTIVANN